MYTSIRYFTPQEAESLLPRLAPMLSLIRREKEKLDAKFKQWEMAERGGKPEEAAILRGQIEFMANELEQQIEEIHQQGCLLKDLTSGLVDFPARIEGREAYLCWKLGEPAIQFWHGITEGYPGRKPL